MIKALLLIISLLGAQQEAIRVQLPSEDVLEYRIALAMSERFVETTKLAQQLANQELEAHDVELYARSVVAKYTKNWDHLYDGWRIREERKLLLVKFILADYPEAIKELQDSGKLEE